jgi:molecular chaperone IbpA
MLHKLDPLFLFNEIANTQNNQYPHFNLKKIDEDKTMIEIALAGIPKEAIDIEFSKNQLTISFQADKDEQEYYFKGISNKSFKRQFKLHEYIKVVSADMENGILIILLEKVIPEELKPKKIQIGLMNEIKPKQFLSE